MKKDMKLKINILFVLFFSFMLFSFGNIYAVDLKYEAAEYIENGIAKEGVIVRTFATAETQKGNDVQKNWQSPTYEKDVSNQGGYYNYLSSVYYFYGDFKLSNYTDNYVDGAIYFTNRAGKLIPFVYDSYDGFVSATSDDINYFENIVEKYGTVTKYISPNNNQPEITIVWDGTKDEENGVYTLRYKDIDSDRLGLYINVNDTYISKGVLDKLREKYEALGYVDDTGRFLKVRMSMGLHTKYNNAGILKNAYEAMNLMKTDVWAPENKGYKDWAKTITIKGTSALNYYDNWLYVPLEKINQRKVEIRYLVRDENGNWKTEKTDIKQFGKDEKSFTKELLGTTIIDGKNPDDTYYIGGKIGKAATKEMAEKNLKVSTDNWGFGKQSFTIGASDDEEYYIVELYYDYRNIHERHLKLDGKNIDSTWNKTYKMNTKDSKILQAKNIPLYYNGKKYVYVETLTSSDSGVATNNPKVKVEGINGKDELIFGGNYYVKFFYEIQPPRKVLVRHLVYNNDTGEYELDKTLTNSNASIKDAETGKYYLRNNGYNQRKYKAGDKNYITSVETGYNEQYIIDYNDTAKIDKSRTIENEGILYKYQGVKIQNNSRPEKLKTKEQANTLKEDTSVELKPNKVSTTYVDFYYIKSDIVPPGEDSKNPDTPTVPDEPSLDFEPQNENGDEIKKETDNTDEKCKIVYVPSGENLKAYMSAITYRPYSLIYEGIGVNETTGEISYALKKYDAYRFVNGAVKNDLNSDYGYFNNTGKQGIFDRNSDTLINPIYDNINQELKKSINYYKGLNPNNIINAIDGRKTNTSDFGSDNVHKVNYNKYNGIRKPTGIANYNVTSLVSGGNDVSNSNNILKDGLAVNTQNDAMVNVFTPASIKQIKVESEKVVNHSNQDSFVIQKNSEFKVTPVPEDITEYYKNITDASKYINHYWLVLDFDVKLLENQIVYSKDSKNISTVGNGTILKAGNLIKIDKGSSFRAIATSEDTIGDTINQFSNKIKVIAVTYNVTDEDFEKNIINTIVATTKSDYVDKDKIRKVESSCEVSNTQTHKGINNVSSEQITKMYDDAHYFVEKTENSKNIGRVYDFKITDCLDVDLKSIFRKSNNGNVNDLRGIKYFAGVRRLLVYGGSGTQLGANQSNRNNVFLNISSIDTTINSIASKTVLPLGPYKHIDASYIQAPKLGYRFAFDLKTSGTYKKSNSGNAPVRYIKITPSYYYISKDGKTFNDNIKLYYKTSSDKYVNFEGSGYAIYFKPNDGYRATYNTETSSLDTMSTKLETLKIGGTIKNGNVDSSFRLTDNMMSYSDNNFVQAWYGEFKLPNSTIAIPKDGNLNNPLTDGYIGVVFKIECIDKETSNSDENDAKVTTIVSYNQNDKSAGAASINTSQWDYEGYLGFSTSNIGKDLQSSLRIQLEKGFWDINTQDMYQKIKGTVVLYDLDNRAAEDFD